MRHSEIHEMTPKVVRGVIPYLEGLNGCHPWHLGPFFLRFVELALTVGMASWSVVFPVCTGNLDVGSPPFSLVAITMVLHQFVVVPIDVGAMIPLLTSSQRAFFTFSL